MDTICVAVFILPDLSAAMTTFCEAATSRSELTRNSLARTMIKTTGLTVAAEPVGYSPMILGTAIMAGTAAMIKNTGEKTNEDR